MQSGSSSASMTRRRTRSLPAAFHPDAVAVRAVRTEPDVCPTLRLAADRPPDRRRRGPSRTAKPASCSRNRPQDPSSAVSAARHELFQGEGPPRFHATQRDERGRSAGSFRDLLQRPVSKDRAAAGERLRHWYLVLRRILHASRCTLARRRVIALYRRPPCLGLISQIIARPKAATPTPGQKAPRCCRTCR